MIVQPHFLDHWKTNALSAAIGRLEAITALLALWGHCQNQRTWQFPNNEMMIAGICRFSGNPRVLVDALLALNLLEKVDENTLEVHGWAELNAQLLHNWDAGKKGGRPRKQPKDKPTENPRVNPSETQGQTLGEPIREDKIREENTPFIPQGGNDQNSASAAAPPDQQDQAPPPSKKKKGAVALQEPEFPADLPPAYHAPLTTWFHHKRQLGKGYVTTGWAALVTQQRKFPASQVAESVETSMANGWTGLFTDKIAAKGYGAQKKGEGAAAVATTEPSWDWRSVALQLWPESQANTLRWQALPASTRCDIREHYTIQNPHNR
jgi:hypothetical protein